MSGRRRIGVLGGTFDPIHLGHLAAAEEVAFDLALDHVLFVPNRVPPHKSSVAVSPAEDRAAMVRLAIASNSRFLLSTVELDRPGPSYTLDTMRALSHDLGGDSRLFFIMGCDGLIDLPTWHEPKALLDEFNLVIMDRPLSDAVAGLHTAVGSDLAIGDEALARLDLRFPGIRTRVKLVHVPQLAISSASLRQRVRDERPIRYQVPREVDDYIREHRLYRGPT